jgi:asparagine synthase (glutamine-hydrolysing)
MLVALRHRGPDESGVYVDGMVALGATRLRVIDPLHGQQPMSNEDGSVLAVFNGEIYNHAELRSRLQGRGHRFRTRSDTEVLVHAYEEWDADCVTNLNGMFAFAIWSQRTGELLLARDQLGIKPLYVHDGPDGVTFASELKAVLASGAVALDPDLEAVDDFLTYEYVPSPRTIIRGVRKLDAGAVLKYSTRTASPPRIRRYWQPTSGPRPASVGEAAVEIRERLRESIRMRLVADVPVGAFLSGGLDSSVMVALMTDQARTTVRTFSIGFDDPSYDESRFAHQVAAHFGTLHRSDRVTETACAWARSIAEAFDEPFGDVSSFATHRVSELAREDVTVALSGDGGDELFAGYDAYRAQQWARRIRALAHIAPWAVIERILDRLPPASSKKGAVNVAKRFVEAFRRPEDLEHARWWVFWDVTQRRALYSPAMRERLSGRDCFGYYRERLAEASARGFHGLDRQQYADVTGYLIDDILVKLDRMSMAVSLEARVPYLDPDLVEYALSVPATWKLRRETGKWILREAFRADLPVEIRRRGKQGFSVPVKQWIRGPLRPLMNELLSEQKVRERGWFDPAEVSRLNREHERGVANHAHRLWCLAALELSLASLPQWTAPAAPDLVEALC